MTYNKYYNLTNTQIIERAANEVGRYHKPTFYVDYIQRNFDRSVSRSHIVKVLGTYKTRIKNIDQRITDKLKELLSIANNDRNLILNLLRRIDA